MEEAIEEAIEEVEADIEEEEEILAEQRPQEMERKFAYLEDPSVVVCQVKMTRSALSAAAKAK